MQVKVISVQAYKTTYKVQLRMTCHKLFYLVGLTGNIWKHSSFIKCSLVSLNKPVSKYSNNMLINYRLIVRHAS